jgi:tetratricopeptide (TPR) repeat protein
MKQRNNSASRIGFVGDQLARVLLFIAAAALAGCQTVGTAPTSEVEENQYAASPANVASLTSVVQRNPNDPQAYNMRGSVLGQAGRNDEALADFNKAISLDPNFGQAYANRGLIQRKTGKLDQALADYGKALELDPNYAVAYLGRGIVYRLKKQPLDAFKDFNKAIAIRPDNGSFTIAACFIRASDSTSLRSTISQPPSACRRMKPNPTSRAA